MTIELTEAEAEQIRALLEHVGKPADMNAGEFPTPALAVRLLDDARARARVPKATGDRNARVLRELAELALIVAYCCTGAASRLQSADPRGALSILGKLKKRFAELGDEMLGGQVSMLLSIERDLARQLSRADSEGA